LLVSTIYLESQIVCAFGEIINNVQIKLTLTLRFEKTSLGIIDILLLNRYRRRTLAGIFMGMVVSPLCSHHTSPGVQLHTSQQEGEESAIENDISKKNARINTPFSIFVECFMVKF